MNQARKNLLQKSLAALMSLTSCGTPDSIKAKHSSLHSKVKPISQPQPEVKATTDEYSGYLTGQGANSKNGQLVGNCITGDSPSSSPIGMTNPSESFTPDGQHIEFQHAEVTSTNQLRRAMNISLAGQASWGLSSGKGKAQFFESSDIKEEDINIYYHIKVLNPEVKLTNVKLTPDALELLEKQGLEALYKRCGDEAIIGYQTGGEMDALIQISSRSSSRHTRAEVAAAAAGISFSASGEIKIDEAKMNNEIRINVKSSYVGGKGEEIKTSPADFKKQAEGWAKVIANHGVVVNLVRVKYSQLAAGAIDPNLSKVQEFIENLESEYDSLSDYVKAAKERISLAKDQTEVNEYARQIAEADKIRDEIFTKIFNCSNDLIFSTCLDSQLAIKSRTFSRNFYERKRDPICGVELWKFFEHPSCGIEPIQVLKQNNAVCGVQLYVGREEKRCRRVGVEGGLNYGETVCDIHFVRRPEYGVERYKDCMVTETKTKICRVEGVEPELFKECLVAKQKI